MPAIESFEILATELPLKKPFKHAAAERWTSYSLFLKCTLDSGTVGWGECLPREYVTGESRDGAISMLRERMLPNLIGKSFDSMAEVRTLFEFCDGKAPPEWVPASEAQTAAWCAVDLALLDAYGKEFSEPALPPNPAGFPKTVRYSGAISSSVSMKTLISMLKMRLYGIRSIKAKVEHFVPGWATRLSRLVLGSRADLRCDANMAWTVEEALETMPRLAAIGIESFEQPLPAEDLYGLARLVEETDFGIMVDESFSDRESLEQIVEKKACTAVNVRISKCGGLIAALSRCREVLDLDLTLQIGCQVGESSLLSAAHLALTETVQHVRYAEGCFGLHLLREDPASPLLQFGRGGKPPARPAGPGLGVLIDEEIVRKHSVEILQVTEKADA